MTRLALAMALKDVRLTLFRSAGLVQALLLGLLLPAAPLSVPAGAAPAAPLRLPAPLLTGLGLSSRENGDYLLQKSKSHMYNGK